MSTTDRRNYSDGEKVLGGKLPSATEPNTNPACVDLGMNTMKARRMLLLHNDPRWSQLACSVDYISLNNFPLHYLGNACVMEKRSHKFCKKVAPVNSAA
jgi:hypothetical protein